MKRGQVTIFVIIALVIVVAIALFLLFSSNREPSTGGQQETSPESFLESCLKEGVQTSIDQIVHNGGSADPDFYLYFKFSEDVAPSKIRYLCYTSDNYAPCTNQDPMLFKSIEDEIKSEIEEEVDFCFLELQKSLENEGYVVEARYAPGDLDVDIKENKVEIGINGEITLTKNAEREVQRNFKVAIPSKIYDLLLFPVQEILRKESSSVSCEFDSAGYSLFYPRFLVDSYTAENGEEIYIIKHKDSDEIFRFAVRSCIKPGGYGV